MNIPDSVGLTLERLENCGYSAYLVGGCVRDYIMGKTPNDYDITTSAKPDEIIRCFPDVRTLDIGVKHGTVTLVFEDMNIEVTTYRVDGEYKDNRRPESVTFTDSICDDLARRDFTVNAIAYSPKRGFADPFDGRGDIDRGIIVCVGEATKRFDEDALRIMRALRFSSRFGFPIEEKTEKAVHEQKGLLKNVAIERIRVELLGLICGKDAGFVAGRYFDVLCEIIPELDNSHRDLLCARLCGCQETHEDVRLCTFMSVLGAEKAKCAMKMLKFDNKNLKSVYSVLSYLESEQDFFGTIAVRRAVSSLDYAGARLFYKTLMCINGSDGIYAENCTSAIDEISRIEKAGDCVFLSQLAVNGNDILSSYSVNGSLIGSILSRLLDDVIEEKCENEKKALLKRAEKYIA